MNNISDFPDRAIIEEEAGAWIIMLDSETEPSEQQRQAFKEWMSRSPAHREEVKNLAKFWGKMNILTELAVPQHIAPHSRKSRRQKQSSPFISNIAIAAYSLSLAVGIALWVQLAPSNSPQNGLYATAVGQQKTIQLRDGSTLQLNTNSQVRVDYTDQHRDIRLLQGEAHFDVAKNPNKPFRVAAGHGLVQAIGTAFAVYLNGDQLNVTVTEGQVGLQSLRPTYKINPAKSAAAQPIKSAAASTNKKRRSPRNSQRRSPRNNQRRSPRNSHSQTTKPRPTQRRPKHHHHQPTRRQQRRTGHRNRHRRDKPPRTRAQALMAQRLYHLQRRTPRPSCRRDRPLLAYLHRAHRPNHGQHKNRRPI